MAEIPERIVDLDCGKYRLRTLTPADASASWAEWMSDGKNLRLLNAAPKAMTAEDLAAYIGRFDQRSHLLIGIFDKGSGRQIGFFRLDLDHRLKRCLMFLLIGERKFRHWSVTHDIRVPFQDYIFDVLGCETILATVLASNTAMSRYMIRSGWHLDHTGAREVKAPVAGAQADLDFLSLSRAAWQAWKAKNLEAG